MRFGPIAGLVDEDALARTLEILVLVAAYRPQERQERPAPQQQGQWDEVDEAAHGSLPARSRRALPTTVSDDADMASAAAKGVIWPRKAIGSATRL